MVDEPESVTEEELLERLQDEMRRITVSDYLAHLLVSLSSMAFQKLGLTAETAGDRDLAQARMAIDAFEALADVRSQGPGKDEASLYASTLHQMRMAYVRASSDTAPAQAEPAAQADADVDAEPGGGANQPDAPDGAQAVGGDDAGGGAAATAQEEG